ncbi:MAG: hypothetical protein HY791_32525 [Deltaproteobacteria bacterium]|nr:hypothetical protein [Deltaproteobacteria bacterium]
MPKYRLEVLLEMRQRAEDDAKTVFGEAQKALRLEEKKLKEEEDMLERMIEDRKRRREEYSRKLASGEMKVTDQSSANRFLDRMKEKESEQKDRIEAQREQVRHAEKDVKKAQDALIEATQALKALQKHKENWEKEVKKERAAKEEDNLDEIGQVIFNQRRK